MSLTEQIEMEDLREKFEFLRARVEALKRLVDVLDCCVDDAEVHHECLDRGWDLKELKREAGL